MPGKQRRDLTIGATVLLGAAYLLWHSFSLPKSSAAYPQMILAALIALDLLVLWSALRKLLDFRTGRDRPQPEETVPATPYLVFLAILLYVVLFQFAGYYLATLAMMIGIMLFFKVRSWKTLVGVPLGYLAFVYFLFELQFRLPL